MKKLLIPIIIVLIGSLGFMFYKFNQVSKERQTIAEDQLGRGNGFRPGDNSGVGMGGQNGLANTKGSCNADGCLAVSDLEYPIGDISEDAKLSLEKALDDEYKAYATYDAVINEFGNVRPFIMIIRAEEQHISSLKGLFDKYGLEIPENPYLGKVLAPGTLISACSVGVQAEIDNAELYRNDLLPGVTDYEDMTLVFNNLMNASQDKHLPAFQKCAQ